MRTPDWSGQSQNSGPAYSNETVVHPQPPVEALVPPPPSPAAPADESADKSAEESAAASAAGTSA